MYVFNILFKIISIFTLIQHNCWLFKLSLLDNVFFFILKLFQLLCISLFEIMLNPVLLELVSTSIAFATILQ